MDRCQWKEIRQKSTIASTEEIFKARKISGDIKVLRVDTNKDQSVDVTFDLLLTWDYGRRNVVHFHEQGVDTWKKFGTRWAEVRTVDKVTKETRSR